MRRTKGSDRPTKRQDLRQHGRSAPNVEMDPVEIGKGALMALAGRVPIFGPVIAGIFAERQRQLFEQRLAQFLEDLREEAANLLADQFPPDYLDSQDYMHLILLVCDHAQRTRQGAKRRLYARALLNAARTEWAPRCDLAEELLNALAELSPMEVRVLQASWEYLTKQQAEKSEEGSFENTVTAENIGPALTDLGLREGEIRAYLGKLQRLGLTEEVTGAILGYGGGAFRMTPLFDRLMELIQLKAP